MATYMFGDFLILRNGRGFSNGFTIDIGRCDVSANETTLHPNNNLKKSKPL